MQYYNMVLTLEQVKSIKEYVKQKPRTVNEISDLLGVNWRTADRYIDKIMETTGTLSVRTFREGTRGALKVVYWSGLESRSFTDLQEELYRKIERGIFKQDFSPFEIYQYIDGSKKNAFSEQKTDDIKVFYAQQKINELLNKAEKDLYCFSGNLSWVNLIEEEVEALKIVEKLASKGVNIKVLCRVNFQGLENIEAMVKINEMLGREAIEMRHVYHPLRGFVLDKKIARFRERVYPSETGLLKNELAVYYELYDEDWIDWLQKVFWKLYQKGVPVKRRLEELKTVRL